MPYILHTITHIGICTPPPIKIRRYASLCYGTFSVNKIVLCFPWVTIVTAFSVNASFSSIKSIFGLFTRYQLSIPVYCLLIVPNSTDVVFLKLVSSDTRSHGNVMCCSCFWSQVNFVLYHMISTIPFVIRKFFKLYRTLNVHFKLYTVHVSKH